MSYRGAGEALEGRRVRVDAERNSIQVCTFLQNRLVKSLFHLMDRGEIFLKSIVKVDASDRLQLGRVASRTTHRMTTATHAGMISESTLFEVRVT